MNQKQFRQLLEQLGKTDWQAIVEGKALLLMDDHHLMIGDAEAPGVIIKRGASGSLEADTLKQESLRKAGAILEKYYFINPLTVKGFNRQAEKLIEQMGAKTFAAISGQLPDCTLFVDGGEIVAATAASVRHRYGVYFEMQHPLDDATITLQVRQWLEQGEAYQHYLNMNVCQFNC